MQLKKPIEVPRPKHLRAPSHAEQVMAQREAYERGEYGATEPGHDPSYSRAMGMLASTQPRRVG